MLLIEEPSLPSRAIFLDRDGTIIEERNYLADPDGVALLAGAAAGLRAMARHGLPLVVISNQSGVGRGYFSLDQAEAVQSRLAALLDAEGVAIAGWYMCPHAPDANCGCRKPAPGMIETAARDLRLEARGSFVVGDKRSDLDLADAVGATGILVTTGHGKADAAHARSRGVPVCDDLVGAAEEIARRLARV